MFLETIYFYFRAVWVERQEQVDGNDPIDIKKKKKKGLSLVASNRQEGRKLTLGNPMMVMVKGERKGNGPSPLKSKHPRYN